MNEPQGNHNAILQDRRKLQLTGVTDVDSFNEEEICLFTQLGELTIKGKDLHINEISVDSGDVSVEGDVWALIYGEKDRRKKLSAIGKIFK
ncbi:sporulation protein YabP [Ruminococcus sp.]|uniref:sporulation protein YabP n=1 Tax=Ruminococcus sp. TaxID=41978 RepID=UPI002600986B|nr:sporulation protein YabP [Ruminococcus sp.]